MEVMAFEKNEINVEILEFTAQEYSDFGFNWFTLSQTTVREQLFLATSALSILMIILDHFMKAR